MIFHANLHVTVLLWLKSGWKMPLFGHFSVWERLAKQVLELLRQLCCLCEAAFAASVNCHRQLEVLLTLRPPFLFIIVSNGLFHSKYRIFSFYCPIFSLFEAYVQNMDGHPQIEKPPLNFDRVWGGFFDSHYLVNPSCGRLFLLYI